METVIYDETPLAEYLKGQSTTCALQFFSCDLLYCSSLII